MNGANASMNSPLFDSFLNWAIFESGLIAHVNMHLMAMYAALSCFIGSHGSCTGISNRSMGRIYAGGCYGGGKKRGSA